jgi:hypothetical protein
MRAARAVSSRALLTLERLCDAAADGEFDDLGVGGKDVLALVAAAVSAARGED